MLIALAATMHALDIPPVPDPIGLGERLAIIDYLKDHRSPAPANATLEQLQALYATAWKRAPENEAAVAADAEVFAARDRSAALRRLIASRFQVTADPGLDEPGLVALSKQLGEAKDAKDAKHIADLAEAHQQKRLSEPPPSTPVAEAAAPVAASPSEPSQAPAAPQSQPRQPDDAQPPRKSKLPPNKELEARGYRYSTWRGAHPPCILEPRQR